MNQTETESTTSDREHEAETDLATVSRPRKILSAAEAIERLRGGETIRQARIDGLTFQKEVPFPVRLRDVRLVHPVFHKAKFAEVVELDYCFIDRPKFQGKTEFAQGLSLQGATIHQGTIRDAIVRGEFLGGNLQSTDRLLFQRVRFEGRARFWDARCGGWIEFKDCEFLDVADCRSICVEEGFVLSNCVFHSDFLCRGATVSKKFDVGESTFEGCLDLAKAKLNDFVYLEGAKQGPKQTFRFQNAIAERVLVRPDQVAGRLASEQTGDHAAAIQEYGLLKRSYEALHRYEDEDWAFYRFKVNQRRARKRSWRKPWTKVGQMFDWLFLDWGCGYGANPARAVRAAVLIILCFAAIYALGIDMLHLEHLPFDAPKTSIANRLTIGLLTSVSTFVSGFGDLREAARGWMNLPLILESLLGTLLWGLFIVAFSRKVIR